MNVNTLFLYSSIISILLMPLHVYAVVFEKPGFTGSIWHDCINLAGNDKQNQGHPGSLNTFNTSLYNNSWTKKMMDSEDYFRFYLNPWPIQTQRACRSSAWSIYPSSCILSSKPTDGFPIILNQNDNTCQYQCTNEQGVRSWYNFTQQDKRKYPTKAYYMDNNQVHVASYGQGLLFIFARLIKDMLGSGIADKMISYPCTNFEDCKQYCKKTLFSLVKGSPLNKNFSTNPIGPTYGYKKTADWLIDLSSQVTSNGEYVCNMTDNSLIGPVTNGCIVYANTDKATYFNPVKNANKLINYAFDSSSGGVSDSASMIECLCDSVFQGATY